MQTVEIERKFVLMQIPEALLQGVQGEQIKQGYLIREQDCELRIRKRDEKYWMTIKRGGGLSRIEQECPIPEPQFEMLWPLTVGRRIEKIRYAVKQQDHLYEIDLFKGALAPLIILEVEFDSLKASRDFEMPSFAAFEVTEDESYKNARLAVSGLPESYLRHQHESV